MFHTENLSNELPVGVFVDTSWPESHLGGLVVTAEEVLFDRPQQARDQGGAGKRDIDGLGLVASNEGR